MKKILIIALVCGVPYSVFALTSEFIPATCCTADYNGTCSHYYCTWGGATTEYTDCETCETNGTIRENNDGSYQPCGTNSAFFDVSVGKCVYGGIVQLCKIGQYNNNGVCTNCPDGGTSQFGASAITECYIPAGTVGSDETGTYQYAENCYYNNKSSVVVEPEIPILPLNP